MSKSLTWTCWSISGIRSSLKRKNCCFCHVWTNDVLRPFKNHHAYSAVVFLSQLFCRTKPNFPPHSDVLGSSIKVEIRYFRVFSWVPEGFSADMLRRVSMSTKQGRVVTPRTSRWGKRWWEKRFRRIHYGRFFSRAIVSSKVSGT